MTAKKKPGPKGSGTSPKPSNRGRKRAYSPPIPWDRLAAMRMALVKFMYEREPLSHEMAKEIDEALALVSREFQGQISKRGRPKDEDNWRVAIGARWLVRMYAAHPEDAINAVLFIHSGRKGRAPGDDLKVAAVYERLDSEPGLEADVTGRLFPGGDVLMGAAAILPKNKNR